MGGVYGDAKLLLGCQERIKGALKSQQFVGERQESRYHHSGSIYGRDDPSRPRDKQLMPFP